MVQRYSTVSATSRNDKYQDAIASAISISQPNIEVPLSSQGKVFFMQEVYGDIDKKVGKERVTVGEYTVNFLFGRPSTWTGTNAVVHHGFLPTRQPSEGVFSRPRRSSPGTVKEQNTSPSSAKAVTGPGLKAPRRYRGRGLCIV